MPNHWSGKPSIDGCLTIKIATLNKWGCLKDNVESAKGVYAWNGFNGEERIGFEVKAISEFQKDLILSYDFRGEPITYYVQIRGRTTNLGNGKRWYFICSQTRKRCMNLISPSGFKYFVHRSAFKLLYSSQRDSYHKNWLFRHCRIEYKLDDLYEELYTKYRKRHYRGKPTPLVKRIGRLEAKIGY